MPVVAYYQGHPASIWSTVMSSPMRAVANPANGAFTASSQPATPVPQRSAPARTSPHPAAPASAWEAWAANWFTPGRQPS